MTDTLFDGLENFSPKTASVAVDEIPLQHLAYPKQTKMKTVHGESPSRSSAIVQNAISMLESAG